MDTFTVVLTVGGALLLVGMVVHELRTRRKAGRVISQQAPTDDPGVTTARFLNSTHQMPGGAADGHGF